MLTSLNYLRPGSGGRLVRLGGDRQLRTRLLELGCLPGTPIQLIRRADVGGVLELEVRRARLTLRLGDAQHLMVETEMVETEPAHEDRS
jgi:ferrous iron transport protein A